jgi:hypothetical protein
LRNRPTIPHIGRTPPAAISVGSTLTALIQLTRI